MTVPIDNGFIYVEPIYIKAGQQGAAIPQMQAIVFSANRQLILVETKSLPEAINQFFARQGAILTPAPGTTGTTGAGTTIPSQIKDTILKQIEQLKQQMDALEKAVRSMK
jgi:uncharacterized membrane protein (UPF0182 family)